VDRLIQVDAPNGEMKELAWAHYLQKFPDVPRDKVSHSIRRPLIETFAPKTASKQVEEQSASPTSQSSADFAVANAKKTTKELIAGIIKNRSNRDNLPIARVSTATSPGAATPTPALARSPSSTITGSTESSPNSSISASDSPSSDSSQLLCEEDDAQESKKSQVMEEHITKYNIRPLTASEQRKPALEIKNNVTVTFPVNNKDRIYELYTDHTYINDKGNGRELKNRKLYKLKDFPSHNLFMTETFEGYVNSSLGICIYGPCWIKNPTATQGFVFINVWRGHPCMKMKWQLFMTLLRKFA
jgi:hypothetical protein